MINPSFQKTILGSMVGVVLASGYVFSERSLNHIKEVHPRQQAVVTCALNHTTVKFGVIDGKRSLEEHKLNVMNGKSWTTRSKHIDGLAVDVVAYSGDTITWQPEPYKQIAGAFYYCSEKLKTPIIWGGNWKARDMGHFECRDKDCL